MKRVLALLHLGLALVAFGIGNAAFVEPDAPSILHLAFGLVLLLTAWALWRSSPLAHWTALLSLGVGALVMLTLLADRLHGGEPTSANLLAAAFAFVVLELFTFRASSPGSRPTPAADG